METVETILLARIVMMVSMTLSLTTLVLIAVSYFSAKEGTHRQIIYRQMPNLVWILHVFIFYVYFLLVREYTPLSGNSMVTYTWGALVILHNVINTMAVTIVKILTMGPTDAIREYARGVTNGTN